MLSAISFIQNTAYELTPANMRLAPPFWSVFTSCNRIHRVWRWYRYKNLYSKPDTFGHLLAGHLLNALISESSLLRIAAQCLLVSNRLLDCANQQAALYKAGKKWLSAFHEDCPRYVCIKWKKKTSWVNPSTSYWMESYSKWVFIRIHEIVLRTLKLFNAAFKLSMSLIDLVEALHWSPGVANQEGVIESFVNINKWMSSLVKQKQKILNGLEKNRHLIESLLKNTSITYTQLFQGVSQTLNKTEILHRESKKISELGRIAFADFGKRIQDSSLAILSTLRVS